ncbi:Aminoglycoside phosphotransferase [Tolypocladium capitatum]|uniref:Aminoglycoside phosphotransferase n=1 Tax=Tolypocladium capitatum TaxID=45235 RepID=A0A2K3QCX7_9HYPO|nr:Aminoglycoside phosphotransferase [Tolypocladium capitatum]
MSETLELLNRDPISYESAARHEDNVIQQLAYVRQTKRLYESLWQARGTIEAITTHHLGLGSTHTCTVLGQHTWIRGSFNVCVPVEVKCGNASRKVVLRCPMPHKLAEARYPGSVDDKLNCEVGTYAWIQDNCPEVPIPHLFGFGFSDNRHFTYVTHRHFCIRLAWSLWRRICGLFRYPVPSQYTSHPIPLGLGTGYILLEFIEPSAGQMLSNTWAKHRDDPARKDNLFRGVARLMLSLARVAQPRIGSFRFHDDGTVALTSRPLFSSTIILENEGAPRIIQRSDTYTCTEAFVSDMLTFHDNRFLNQPNAVYSEDDCRGQMAVKTLLRTLSHHYIDRDRRNGPFLLQLTDLHSSNIFVDNDWNVTRLIDLEWVCSLPREMLAVPYWLTGRGIDQITEEQLDDFDKVRQDFMRILQEEEQAMSAGKGQRIPLARTINNMWESRGVWFWHCLDSVNAMYRLLEDHMCPSFSASLSPEAERIMSDFWCEGSAGIVAKKLADKESYDRELRQIFNEGMTVEVSEK